MPRKVFTAGEVLSASNVNNFLMDQSVMTFAGTAARSSAIGTATEGMVTWLNDSNSLEVYDGTRWNRLAAPDGNAIINGGFDIWQRGTSTASTGFLADRWASQVVGGSSYTQSRQNLGLDTSQSTTGTPFFYRHQHTPGAGVGDYALISHKLEDVSTFANRTVTLSFYATADSTRNLSIEFVQNFGSGGSGNVSTTPQKIQITTAVNRYTVTLTLPDTTGKTKGANSFVEIFFWFDAGSNFNSRTDSLGHQSGAYTFNIWGVQLEAGQTASVFRRNANSLQGELAACQRYYYRMTATSTNETMAWGAAYNTGTARFSVTFPVTMRIRPTALEASATASDYQIAISGIGAITCTVAPSFSAASPNLATLNASTTSGMTAYHPVSLNSVATNAFLGWSAEL